MVIKEKPRTKAQTPEEFITSAKADTAVEPTKKLIVEIPLSLHNKLKIKAAQENSTIKKIVGDLLKEHIQ
jgi:hypothetical protein